jgi:hypothetical protein
MKRRVLIIVASDPRVSPRPAEAVRIAAGVGAWETIEAVLYLRGPAVLALGENAEELVDGDNFVRYLPLAPGAGRRICVPRGESLLSNLGEMRVRFDSVSDDELARFAANSDYVLRF